MTKKKVTYNKDGSVRKSGSGRKKGSNSFVRIAYLDLKDYISEKTPISVSRVWLENLGIDLDGEKDDKFKVKQSSESDSSSEVENKIQFSLRNFNVNDIE